MWLELTEKERKDFYRRYRVPFFQHLSAFPLSNAEKLDRLIEKGQLNFLGGVKEVERAEGLGFKITFGNGASNHYPWVIDASGYDSSVIQKHPFRINVFGGLDVDSKNGKLKNVQGETEPGAFALGFSAKGSVALSNWYNRIVKIADAVSQQLNY